MKLFGWEISRSKAFVPASVSGSSEGWFPVIREPFTGAWQRNRELRRESVSSFYAVNACVTMIASDIAKCRIRLVEQGSDKIWRETQAAAFTPVLTKPNRYQNRIQFYEQWMYSKLLQGNTYVLKERDNRNVVTNLYILDPSRTRPLVAADGSVYYQLYADNLSGVDAETIVPASEVIHDRNAPMYHPLYGISPIMACGLGAAQGLAIQNYSSDLFANGSQPGGILTTTQRIAAEDAQRIKEKWEQNYSGNNVGRVAILGNGMEYKSWAMNSVDAQLIEQLKWAASQVCSVFHVPEYKIVGGAQPTHNNIEALDQQYYTQCLQKHFKGIELALDEGLGLVATTGHVYGVEFDMRDLLRMDTATMVETIEKAVKAGVMSPNEGRLLLNLPATEGGDTPYMQQQNFSLAALAKRDAQGIPVDQPAADAPPAEAPAEDTPADPAAKMLRLAYDNPSSEEFGAEMLAAWDEIKAAA